jgi:VIT1/CCC1 family predicted Fe2+/Mn2+ transporter
MPPILTSHRKAYCGGPVWASSEADMRLGARYVAGAMSMAAGEYVSVSSQSDIEMADLAREKRALSEDPEFEKAAP